MNIYTLTNPIKNKPNSVFEREVDQRTLKHDSKCLLFGTENVKRKQCHPSTVTDCYYTLSVK